MGSSEDPSLVNNVDDLGLVYYGVNIVGKFIRMDLQEAGGSCGDWMELGQDRGGGGRLWVR